MHFELAGKRIFVAGHKGMVGGAIVRRLAAEACEVVVAGREVLDLVDQAATREWVRQNALDAIVIAAARVGGILANMAYPVQFLHDNLMIASNLIEAAHRADVNRVLFLGSSCIYPRSAEQPIKEEALLSGPLEHTNEWYAVAKIAGIKLAQAYRRQYGRDYVSAMPTNLYGAGDNFDLQSSHVLPALIRKAHDAKVSGAQTMTIWGTGAPRREFLHADDCADACVFLLENYSQDLHINVGSGADISILELAELVSEVVGFVGGIEKDESKPDGTPRKLMCADRIRALGWAPSIELRDGIAQTYRWYLENKS